jgi:hypothetical protein
VISVNSTNRVARLDLLAVLLVETALVVVLHRVGADTYSVPLRSTVDWLQTADPTVVLVALARLMALAIGYWLVTTTVLYAGSYHLGWASMTRALHWVTLPIIRRTVQGVTALSLTGVSILGPSSLTVAPALAQEVVAAQQDTGVTTGSSGDQVESEPAIYSPDAAGWPQSADNDFWLPSGLNQTPSSTYTVVSHDHFWSIAENHLKQVVGREVTDDEVGQYWVRVVDANRATIRSGDPDLIYPLERVTLPPVFSE